MPYLTNLDDIREAIAHCAQQKILWLDTEVADYNSAKPRLSLIQVLDNSTDLSGEQVIILDVLDHLELVKEFIAKIMSDAAIEKVFHNARYDITFLGKRQAKNITCTLEMVEKIPYYIVPIPNRQLKTLAEVLCHFSAIDKSQQAGDWGRRPLSEKQLNYARMDPIYTAQVHHRLLQLQQLTQHEPRLEDLTALTRRYREIIHEWKILDTEISHLKERIKKAMYAQQKSKINGFELASQNRTTKEVDLHQLAAIIVNSEISIDLPIKLTSELQKALGDVLNQLTVEEKREQILTLRVKEPEEEENSELPF